MDIVGPLVAVVGPLVAVNVRWRCGARDAGAGDGDARDAARRTSRRRRGLAARTPTSARGEIGSQDVTRHPLQKLGHQAWVKAQRLLWTHRLQKLVFQMDLKKA